MQDVSAGERQSFMFFPFWVVALPPASAAETPRAGGTAASGPCPLATGSVGMARDELARLRERALADLHRRRSAHQLRQRPDGGVNAIG